MMFNTLSRTRRGLTLGAAALAACAAQPAIAATTTSNLSVTATVTSNCAVSTSAVAFGNVNVTSGSAVNGTGSLSVTCTNGTGWSAAAGAGAGTGANLAVRKMAKSSDLLSYALYTDSGRTTVWGDGADSTATIDGTGTGSAQPSTIYGQILANQASAPAGSYADTVVVTLTY